MRIDPQAFVEPPAMEPVIALEVTEAGWRGLTADGEILEVRSANGHKAPVPEDGILIMRQGKPIGRRAINADAGDVNVGAYLDHYNRALTLHRSNEHEAALTEIEAALVIAATTRARFNRALILLAIGCWNEGFDEFAECENQPPLQRPWTRQALDRGLWPWRGEAIAGKKLLLLHDHGFGDSIMCLRYVESLKRMGADVVMVMPPELQRLAAQCGRVVAGLEDADYFCSMLLLPRYVEHMPHGPYLTVDPGLADKWRMRLDHNDCRRTGIAWSIGKEHDGDYPRAIPLELLVASLPIQGDLLFSVQAQGAAEAEACGVTAFPFEDFADCAAFMSHMDEIVSVDTAALHLAGAIGHPRVTGLLSHWASWRWRDNLFYPATRLLQQQAPDDWASALAQL